MKFKKIKTLFLDILSFGTPQARVFNIFFIFFILGVVPTGSLEYSPINCIFKQFLLPLVFRGNCPTSGLFANCECPACGLMHAISRLLHGDFAGAWSFNKLVFIVFIVMTVILITNLIISIRYYKKTGKIYPL